MGRWLEGTRSEVICTKFRDSVLGLGSRPGEIWVRNKTRGSCCLGAAVKNPEVVPVGTAGSKPSRGFQL